MLVKVTTRHPATGLPPLEVDEEVRLQQQGVQLFLTGAAEGGEGNGTLVITTRSVLWLSSTDEAKGYKVDFPTISLHAISRDPASFAMPCIYCQLDIEEECMTEQDGDGEEDEETSGVSEARFVPGAEDDLEAIFKVFCECALLNPSGSEDEDEDDEEGGGFFTAETLGAGGAPPALGTAAGNLAHYDRLLEESGEMGGMALPVDAMGAMMLSDDADGMFADAEEEGEDAAGGGGAPRSSWPELVGQEAGAAMAAIAAERPDLAVERVPEGAMVTMDMRMDRVRVFVGVEGNVGMEPQLG